MQRFIAPFLLMILALPAYAGIGKVSSPTVNKGVAEVEYSGVRYGDSDGSRTNEQKHLIELEYSFTDRFKFGIETELEREAGGKLNLKPMVSKANTR